MSMEKRVEQNVRNEADLNDELGYLNNSIQQSRGNLSHIASQSQSLPSQVGYTHLPTPINGALAPTYSSGNQFGKYRCNQTDGQVNSQSDTAGSSRAVQGATADPDLTWEWDKQYQRYRRYDQTTNQWIWHQESAAIAGDPDRQLSFK
jgi:hypothetical protein